MAFTDIDNGDVDGDSPLDETLMTALRDNDNYLKTLFAIATGHTHDQAGTDEGGPVVPADGAVTPAKLYYWIAGDTLYNSNDTQVNTTSDTYVKVKETQVPRGGTYRVKFRMWRGSGGTVYATIYKNGVAYGTERSTSAASPGVTFSEDLAFEPDDLIQIYFRRSATYTMSLADFRLYIGTDQQDPINTLT